MLTVQATETIRCSPEELVEFIMDIERYQAIDDKISPVLWAKRDGDHTEFACRPKLAGMRLPKVVQELRRVSPYRVEISVAPWPRNKLSHLSAHFEATMEAQPVAEGVRMTRTLNFEFKPMTRWLLEPLLRAQLPAQLTDELTRAKAYLEQVRAS